MKKWNYLWIFLVLFMVACSGTPRTGGVCENIAPDASLICANIPNPEDVDLVLRLGNATLISEDVYTATQALETVTFLETLLKTETITYSYFYQMLKLKTDPRIFIIMEEFETRFGALDVNILPYDIELLLKHLDKQRRLILLYTSRINTQERRLTGYGILERVIVRC